ncbi:hypothetical protein [Actinomadura sp. NBRC 104425]|uniref:hypothetical protein n=1 Tax=Actinomadura sp. NBRC 104425 TaxID=3032204 RepID=UPI0025557FBA|nr:hypothetical protein [Actinomadura sp. NBRC 104425]
MPEVGVGRQGADEAFDLRQSGPQPLVAAGLLRDEGEQVAQVGADVPQPAGLGGECEHGLHHRQADQFGVAEIGGSSGQPNDPGRVVLDLDVPCDHEGVRVSVHNAISDTLFACRGRSTTS